MIQPLLWATYIRPGTYDSHPVTADYLEQIPKLPYKPATTETWEAIKNSKLDKTFGAPHKDEWEEAELPIGDCEKEMLQSYDTDMIERFGYISHLISQKYPAKYADLVDYKGGRVVMVRTKNLFEKKVHAKYSVQATNGPKFKTLQDNKVPLTEEERQQVMNAKAVWHHGPNGEPTPAVWKAKVNDDVWYVTHTHRAFNTAKSLKGAISRYHKFIKTTAANEDC